jgi:hypothetical protein
MSAKKKTAADLTLSSMKINAGRGLDKLPSATHRKLTVSLFPADMEAADHLMELLRRHCEAVPTRSDAVKLALRIAAAAARPETVKQHYSAIRQEDGRGRVKI